MNVQSYYKLGYYKISSLLKTHNITKNKQNYYENTSLLQSALPDLITTNTLAYDRKKFYGRGH